MLKRGTVLLMMGAIALGGGVLLFESKQRSASVDTASEVTSTASEAEASALGGKSEGEGDLIFSFTEADVDGVTIKRPDGTLVFSKSADDTWQMSQPQAATAESGAIAFLLAQLTNPTVRTLAVEASTLKDFGLANPDTTVTLSAKGQSYQLAVGIADFSGDKLYVRPIEPDSAAPESPAADPTKVYVVSGGLENAVNRPITGWLAIAPDAAAPAASAPAAANSNATNPASANPVLASPEVPNPAAAASEAKPKPATEGEPIGSGASGTETSRP